MRHKIFLSVISLLGLSMVFWLDHWYQSDRLDEKFSELRATVEMCRTHLENSVSARFNALQAVASLFQLHPETTREEFIQYAAYLAKDNPPVRSLQYADPQTRVIYVYPEQSNEIVIESPLVLIDDPLRGAYVRKAIRRKQATLQGPFDLRQGGSGVVLRKPIFIGDRFAGLAIGVYDVPVLINEALAGINRTSFCLALFDGQGRLFFGDKTGFENGVKMSVRLADAAWSLVMNWKPAILKPSIYIRLAIWLSGIALILFVLLIAHQSWRQNQQLSRLVARRTEDLTQANETLTLEIARHRQTARIMKENETKYRSMMDALEDSVYICSRNFTIEYMNPAMIKRIGRDATGEKCHETLYDRPTKCPWCVHHQIQKGRSLENNITSPKDNRTYRVTHLPIAHEDGAISKMTIFRDITDYLAAVAEKEKTAAQLQHAQKMEAIGTLAGGIAHDFNNILSSVIGYTELCLEDSPPGSIIQRNLLEILTAGHRARELVKQILTFARKTDTELKPVQVSLIAKEALRLLRSSIPATIDIQDEITSDTLVMGNIIQIHQIFLNLCTNAAHAMEEKGGILKVSLTQVFLDDKFIERHAGLCTGDYLKLEVSDTGTGISQAVMPSIFEPYFTTKPTGEGTGMGLAIVHGIVKSYGGDVLVDSTVGKGSVFSIYLPVCKRRLDRGKRAKPEHLPPGHEHIMLVDDEAPIIRIAKHALEQLGYKVTPHTSSIEALADFESRPEVFDLVITDMTMPKMTGDRLARALMEIKPAIPIVLCTGYSKKVDQEMAIEMGIKAFVMKPIMKKDLLVTVRRVLDGMPEQN